MTKMKDFAQEMRMVSRFKPMLEEMASSLPMELTDEEYERLASMMAHSFGNMLEATLAQMFMRNEELAMLIGNALEAEETKGDNAIKMLYDMLTEVMVISLAHEALLFASLGGLDLQNEDE